MSLGLKVLQVGPLYGNHVRRWSEHAAALGCSVRAAGHVTAGRSQTRLDDLSEQVDVVEDWVTGADPRKHLRWLRRIMREARPDVVHAHWLPTWGYLATVASDAPVVLTPWGSDIYLAAGDARARATAAIRSADRVLARSAHMGRELTDRGVRAGRIRFVDLGVNLDRFRPVPPTQRARLRQELGLPATGPLILSLRAATPLYRLEVVVEAFACVRRHRPDATLVLVHGDLPLPHSLRERLTHARGVHVVGRREHDEIRRYTGAASACVSIPSSDGSPSSVWETMAAGVPMVLSALPQLEERVGPSGAAILVDPTPKAVAAALLSIVEHPERARRMSRAARSWAVTNVDERSQVRRLGEVYGELAERAHARPGFPARR